MQHRPQVMTQNTAATLPAGCYLPQLKTTQSRAMDLARSLVVSVLPVPAGPAGAPPSRYVRAVVRVM